MFDLVRFFDNKHPDLGPDWVTDFLTMTTARLRDDFLLSPAHTADKNGVYTISYTIPGFKKSELSVELQSKNLLVVSAHKNGKAIVETWTLHPQFDESTVKAQLEDGILTVTYKLLAPTPPKKESTRKVEIT